MKHQAILTLHTTAMVLLICSCKKETDILFSEANVTKVNVSSSVSSSLFICSPDATVYCLNPLSGNVIWQKDFEGSCNSTPVFAKGTIYFQAGDSLYALKAANGQKLWSRRCLSSRACLAYDSGKLYVPTLSKVLCINPANGKIIWQFKRGATYRYSPSSSPAIINGTLYIGDNDQRLTYALNASIGAVKWSYEGVGSPVYSSPGIYQNKLFGVHEDGDFYALDTSSGALAWTHLYNFDYDESPTIAAGRLYISSTDVYCVNPNNGDLYWHFADTSSIHRELTSNCFVKDNVVYADFFEHIYALDATTGNIIWHSLLERSETDPVVDNGIAYFTGYYTSNLYALDASTGTLLWSHPLTGSYPESAPIIVKSSGEAIYPTVSGMRQ